MTWTATYPRINKRDIQSIFQPNMLAELAAGCWLLATNSVSDEALKALNLEFLAC
jgi:hypothetical protein